MRDLFGVDAGCAKYRTLQKSSNPRVARYTQCFHFKTDLQTPSRVEEAVLGQPLAAIEGLLGNVAEHCLQFHCARRCPAVGFFAATIFGEPLLLLRALTKQLDYQIFGSRESMKHGHYIANFTAPFSLLVAVTAV